MPSKGLAAALEEARALFLDTATPATASSALAPFLGPGSQHRGRHRASGFVGGALAPHRLPAAASSGEELTATTFLAHARPSASRFLFGDGDDVASTGGPPAAPRTRATPHTTAFPGLYANRKVAQREVDHANSAIHSVMKDIRGIYKDMVGVAMERQRVWDRTVKGKDGNLGLAPLCAQLKTLLTEISTSLRPSCLKARTMYLHRGVLCDARHTCWCMSVQSSIGSSGRVLYMQRPC